jgi:hypothetical protein
MREIVIDTETTGLDPQASSADPRSTSTNYPNGGNPGESGVDRSDRTQYGAMLHGELFAAVYVGLTTARKSRCNLNRSRCRRRTFRQSPTGGPSHCRRA